MQKKEKMAKPFMRKCQTLRLYIRLKALNLCV